MNSTTNSNSNNNNNNKVILHYHPITAIVIYDMYIDFYNNYLKVGHIACN